VAYLPKKKMMIIYKVDSLEAIDEARSTVLRCAEELRNAQRCEMRFNEDLTIGLMRGLGNDMARLNQNLKGGWFSARVKVRGNKEVHMLTTKEGRRVSNILSRSQVDVFINIVISMDFCFLGLMTGHC
jgi:hypothetical protein